jgi:hypothetical protein
MLLPSRRPKKSLGGIFSEFLGHLLYSAGLFLAIYILVWAVEFAIFKLHGIYAIGSDDEALLHTSHHFTLIADLVACAILPRSGLCG